MVDCMNYELVKNKRQSFKKVIQLYPIQSAICFDLQIYNSNKRIERSEKSFHIE